MAKKKSKKRKLVCDKQMLYTAAVQSVDADADFFQRIYKKKRGERCTRLREDFCGTAALACEWVGRSKQNEAWGVDLHRPTLDWGRKYNVPTIGAAAERLHLIEGDVLEPREPAVDVAVAMNFSYSVFKNRELLGRYFSVVRKTLRPGGILFTDALGGPEAMDSMLEKRKIKRSKAPDGTKVPGFTYVWEQASFNPVNHDFKCHIHFKLPDGSKMKRAFTYDWRLWTLPEVQELMIEAGFAETAVYGEGWDDETDDTDGIFRRRKKFDNQSAWVAYVVGFA